MSEIETFADRCDNCQFPTDYDDLHACPYAQALGDEDVQCNCCEECKKRCLEDAYSLLDNPQDEW